jgi:hypothetical protein
VKQKNEFALIEGRSLFSDMDIGLFLIADSLQKKVAKAGICRTYRSFPVF